MAKFSKVSPLLPCRHLKPNLLFDVSLHFPPNTPDLGFSPSLLKFGTRSSTLIRVWGTQRGCGIFSLWQELRAVKTLKKITGLLDYLGKPRSGSRSRQILQQAELYSHSPQNAEFKDKAPWYTAGNPAQSQKDPPKEWRTTPSCSSGCLSLLYILHLSPCLPLKLWAPRGVE